MKLRREKKPKNMPRRRGVVRRMGGALLAARWTILLTLGAGAVLWLIGESESATDTAMLAGVAFAIARIAMIPVGLTIGFDGFVRPLLERGGSHAWSDAVHAHRFRLLGLYVVFETLFVYATFFTGRI